MQGEDAEGQQGVGVEGQEEEERQVEVDVDVEEAGVEEVDVEEVDVQEAGVSVGRAAGRGVEKEEEEEQGKEGVKGVEGIKFSIITITISFFIVNLLFFFCRLSIVVYDYCRSV